jgi:hypothetical protein
MAVNKTIHGFINSANETLDKFMSAAQGVLCIASTIGKFIKFTNGLFITGDISIGKLKSIGKELIQQGFNSILGTVQSYIHDQIYSRLYSIFGIALGTAYRIANIIRNLRENIGSLIARIQGIRNKAENIFNHGLKTENCTFNSTYLAQCILGKLLDPMTASLNASLKQKLAGLDAFDKVDDFIADLNKYSNQLTDTGSQGVLSFIGRKTDSATKSVNTYSAQSILQNL